MSSDSPKPSTSDAATLEELLRLAKDVPCDEVIADFEDSDLQALIDRAVEPYVGLLTPKALERARATLAVVFTTHPDAVASLERQRHQPPPAGSGVVTKRGARSLVEAAEELRRTASRGKQR